MTLKEICAIYHTYLYSMRHGGIRHVACAAFMKQYMAPYEDRFDDDGCSLAEYVAARVAARVADPEYASVNRRVYASSAPRKGLTDSGYLKYIARYGADDPHAKFAAQCRGRLADAMMVDLLEREQIQAEIEQLQETVAVLGAIQELSERSTLGSTLPSIA
jgi:hypothetical protein